MGGLCVVHGVRARARMCVLHQSIPLLQLCQPAVTPGVTRDATPGATRGVTRGITRNATRVPSQVSKCAPTPSRRCRGASRTSRARPVVARVCNVIDPVEHFFPLSFFASFSARRTRVPVYGAKGETNGRTRSTIGLFHNKRDYSLGYWWW